MRAINCRLRRKDRSYIDGCIHFVAKDRWDPGIIEAMCPDMVHVSSLRYMSLQPDILGT